MATCNVPQIDIITAISRVVSRAAVDQNGDDLISPRQINAIFKAADMVVGAMAVEDHKAYKGMGLAAWLECDDKGMSSLYMAHVMYETPRWAEQFYPVDPSDFGRCYRFLEAVDGARDRLDIMGLPACGRVWRDLVAAWEELERLYLEELPTGRCPKLYARMQEIIDPKKKAGQG